MIRVRGLERRYGRSLALSLNEWDVAAGEHWAVLGASGSGKSTLLHILAGLLAPTSGEVSVDGQALAALLGDALDRFRGRAIGIVPQALHLIPSLRVAENLALAQHLGAGASDPKAIAAILGELGLAEFAHRLPRELSQGQRQRVAIARAVINRPKLVLADEPTANLDDGNAARALELLRDAAQACGAALVIATHDARVRSRLPQALELEVQQ